MQDPRIHLLCQLLSPEDAHELSNLASAHTRQEKCDCTQLMQTHRELKNPLGHIILRTPQQFDMVVPELTSFFTEHARTPLLPATCDVKNMMQQLRRQLLQTLLPLPMPTACTPLTHPDADPTPALPLMSVTDIDQVVQKIIQHCEEEAHTSIARAP